MGASERQDVVAAPAGVPVRPSNKNAMIIEFRIDLNKLQKLINENFEGQIIGQDGSIQMAQVVLLSVLPVA